MDRNVFLGVILVTIFVVMAFAVAMWFWIRMPSG